MSIFRRFYFFYGCPFFSALIKDALKNERHLTLGEEKDQDESKIEFLLFMGVPEENMDVGSCYILSI